MVIACCQTVCAQEDSTLLYLRYPVIPAFKVIMASDSTTFTAAKLSKKKATMVIVFDPHCENCIEETKRLIAHIDVYKKIQVLMVSPAPYSEIKQFHDELKIADYPNIIMGRDPGYFFGTFYKVRSFPSIFLYNKKGDFVRKFDGSTPVETIPSFL